MPFSFDNSKRMFNNDGSVNQSYSSNSMFNTNGNTNDNYNPYAQNKIFGFAGNNNYNINDVSSYPQIQEANKQFNNTADINSVINPNPYAGQSTKDIYTGYEKSKSPSKIGMMYAMGALGNMSPMQGNMEYYGNTVGRGIENGNTGQIIGGGIGMALSGFKSVMAGSGAANIQNFLQKEGMRKYRQAIDDTYGQENLSNMNTMRTGFNYADGGEMPQEQQITPEMIIQAYAQMQGMNEQQMGQLMQELQNLSPEEQQQAIQEMAQVVQQSQQQQQMAQEQAPAPQEEMAPEQMAPEGEPMMSYGGKIGLYAGGGEYYLPSKMMPTSNPLRYEMNLEPAPMELNPNVAPVKNNYVYKNAQGNLVGYSTDQNPNMNKDVILDSSQVQNNKYIYKDKNGNVIGIGNESTMYGKEGNRRVGMPVYKKGGLFKNIGDAVSNVFGGKKLNEEQLKSDAYYNTIPEQERKRIKKALPHEDGSVSYKYNDGNWVTVYPNNRFSIENDEYGMAMGNIDPSTGKRTLDDNDTTYQKYGEQAWLKNRPVFYDNNNEPATEQDYIDQGYSENAYKSEDKPKRKKIPGFLSDEEIAAGNTKSNPGMYIEQDASMPNELYVADMMRQIQPKRKKIFGLFASGGEMNEMQDEMMEEKKEMSKLSVRKDKKGTQYIVEKEETPVRRQDVIDFKRWLNDNGMNVKIDGKLDASLLNKAEQAGMSFESFKEKKMESEENMKMYGGRIKENMVEYMPVFKKK